jgi:hypothetical protein
LKVKARTTDELEHLGCGALLVPRLGDLPGPLVELFLEVAAVRLRCRATVDAFRSLSFVVLRPRFFIAAPPVAAPVWRLAMPRHQVVNLGGARPLLCWQLNDSTHQTAALRDFRPVNVESRLSALLGLCPLYPQGGHSRPALSSPLGGRRHGTNGPDHDVPGKVRCGKSRSVASVAAGRGAYSRRQLLANAAIAASRVAAYPCVGLRSRRKSRLATGGEHGGREA